MMAIPQTKRNDTTHMEGHLQHLERSVLCTCGETCVSILYLYSRIYPVAATVYSERSVGAPYVEYDLYTCITRAPYGNQGRRDRAPLLPFSSTPPCSLYFASAASKRPQKQAYSMINAFV